MRVKQLTKKDWIILWCFLAVVAVIAVYFVPIPISAERTFCGAVVTKDGTVLEECEFTVKYMELNYIFREDCYSEVSVDVGGMHFDTQSHTENIYPDTLRDSQFEWFMINSYNKSANAMGDIASICYGTDWEWCFVRARQNYDDEYQYFVGSLDEDADLQSILAYCEVFLD